MLFNLKYEASWLISGMVLGLLYQLQTFCPLHVMELLGLFNRSGTTWAIAVYISKAFNKVGHASLLHKWSCMEFQVRYLALFHLFSIIDDFELFWMVILCQNAQLMQQFVKTTFLFLYFLVICKLEASVKQLTICSRFCSVFSKLLRQQLLTASSTFSVGNFNFWASHYNLFCTSQIVLASKTPSIYQTQLLFCHCWTWWAK